MAWFSFVVCDFVGVWQVAGNPLLYSQAQIANFLKSSQLNSKIMSLRDVRAEDGGGGERIASDAKRKFMLLKEVQVDKTRKFAGEERNSGDEEEWEEQEDGWAALEEQAMYAQEELAAQRTRERGEGKGRRKRLAIGIDSDGEEEELVLPDGEEEEGGVVGEKGETRKKVMVEEEEEVEEEEGGDTGAEQGLEQDEGYDDMGECL